MRIVGGTHRGKKLHAPSSDATRPTSDRVREALFNRLSHGFDDFALDGARVLDLFAGTGALGLEAMSRGANFALFVEDATPARGLIRRNIEDMELTGQTKLFRRNALHLGPLKQQEPFSLIFLDPPYGKAMGERALASAIEGGWLADNALIILEEAKASAIDWPDAVALLDARAYGDTTIHFARYSGTSSPGA